MWNNSFLGHQAAQNSTPWERGNKYPLRSVSRLHSRKGKDRRSLAVSLSSSDEFGSLERPSEPEFVGQGTRKERALYTQRERQRGEKNIKTETKRAVKISRWNLQLSPVALGVTTWNRAVCRENALKDQRHHHHGSKKAKNSSFPPPCNSWGIS